MSAKRCDATKKDGTLCNLPMCDKHANKVEDDTHVCHFHNSRRYIEQAKENRGKRAEARRYFMERYSQLPFRVIPGHWPDFASKEEVDRWIDLHQKIIASTIEDEGEVYEKLS